MKDPPGPLPTPGDWVDIHYTRPGTGTTVFRQRVLAAGPSEIVTFQAATPVARPTCVDETAILEPGAPVIWFTMPGLWHDIGLFHLADGSPTGVYANVLTPVELIDGHSWATTDLCLDVWLPHGGDPQLLDEADLEAGVRQGWITSRLADRATREASSLIALWRSGDWPPESVGRWTLERALGARQALRDRGRSEPA